MQGDFGLKWIGLARGAVRYRRDVDLVRRLDSSREGQPDARRSDAGVVSDGLLIQNGRRGQW